VTLFSKLSTRALVVTADLAGLTVLGCRSGWRGPLPARTGTHLNAPAVARDRVRQKPGSGRLADRGGGWAFGTWARMRGRYPGRDAAGARAVAGQGDGRPCSRERAKATIRAAPPGITGEPRLINGPALEHLPHKYGDEVMARLIRSRSRKS